MAAVKIPQYQQRVLPQGQNTPLHSVPGISIPDNPFQIASKTLGQAAGLAGEFQTRERRAEAEFEQQQEKDARLHVATEMPKVYTQLETEYETMARDAGPGAKDFAKNWGDRAFGILNTHRESADTPAKKNAMTLAGGDALRHYSLKGLTYQRAEATRYQAETLSNGANEYASVVYANPGAVENFLGAHISGIEATNMAPDQKAILKESARKQIAVAAAQGWIDSNPATAHAELEKAMREKAAYAGDIPLDILTQDERSSLLGHAKAKHNEAKQQKFASIYIASATQAVDKAPIMAGDFVHRPTAKAAAIALAEKSMGPLDAQQRLDVDRQVEARIADRELDIKRGRESQMAAMNIELERNGGDIQALKLKYPGFSSMPPDYRKQIDAFAESTANGGRRETDWPAYAALIENHDVLRGANLPAMKGKFNRTAYAQLEDLQKKLRQGIGEQNIVSDHAIVVQLLDDAGYKHHKDKQAVFFSMLQSAINLERGASGTKDLPQDRVRAIANDLLKEEIVKKGIWLIFDSKDRSFEINVPAAERVKIEEALRSLNMPINDYTVMTAYRDKLRETNQRK